MFGYQEAVHPHACGVYSHFTSVIKCYIWSIPTHVGFTFSTSFLAGSQYGPSPRMWGLLLWMFIPILQNRSIPTHVGFTPYPRSLRASRSVHPHACGVYCLFLMSVVSNVGPSPRMWGLRWAEPPAGDGMRSIPTHVGFTFFHCLAVISFPGPSPRMWGLRRGACTIELIRPVHPHACGVYEAAERISSFT